MKQPLKCRKIKKLGVHQSFLAITGKCDFFCHFVVSQSLTSHSLSLFVFLLEQLTEGENLATMSKERQLVFFFLNLKL